MFEELKKINHLLNIKDKKLFYEGDFLAKDVVKLLNELKNEEIKMTTPVTQVEKKGNMIMQFYLPLKFNKENTPAPSSQDIKILNIKEGYYAVIKYSGRASDKNFTKHKGILENELKKDDISILSAPIKATYDGPFTLPMDRRNEAMFEINIKNKGEI